MILTTKYPSFLRKLPIAIMVRGRAQGRDQPIENLNPEFMTILLSIQQRLDDQIAIVQQHDVVIQNIQQ